MDTSVVLFLLRLVSGALLVGLLVAMMVIMWRDHRHAVSQIQAARRTYGQLVALRHLDDDALQTGDVYPLLPLTSLGRAPTNTVPIQDTFASSEHAQVTLRGGQWWLEDRRSRNGTLLNGEPVTQPVVVTQGDIITIGSVSFRLELE